MHKVDVDYGKNQILILFVESYEVVIPDLKRQREGLINFKGEFRQIDLLNGAVKRNVIVQPVYNCIHK